MERERVRNYSYDTYQENLNFEAKMISERLKAKRIFRSEEINVQWNGHGYTHYIEDWPLKTIRVFYGDIPPKGHNIEHKHVSEAVTYIVKGHGHTFIGGTKDDERATTVGERVEWKAGDFLMVPPNIWHVFYNDDEKEWARFMGITSPILKQIGLAATHHHGNEGRSPIPEHTD
ncbi:MAG: cupin domain-containing protein [Thaumarchaeota archaeon]|nr:cupin domain-containing protein [Nitrososphaerota archaeon]